MLALRGVVTCGDDQRAPARLLLDGPNVDEPASNGTIGVEMTLLFNMFAVYDLWAGGSPSTTRGKSCSSLYLLVADLSEGVDKCCEALEEQLSILSASVPDAVMVVVLTKMDKVVGGEGGGGDGGGGGRGRGRGGERGVGGEGKAAVPPSSSPEVHARVIDVEQRLMKLCTNRQRRRNKVSEGSLKVTTRLRIQFPVLCTNSFTPEGIAALHDRMVGTASVRKGEASSPRKNGLAAEEESSASAEPKGGDTKLFPRFNAKVPMSYEKVRLILNAMKIWPSAPALAGSTPGDMRMCHCLHSIPTLSRRNRWPYSTAPPAQLPR